MTKPYYKLIIQIPASFNLKIHNLQKQVWLQYMNLYPEIKAVFVYGKILKTDYEKIPEDLEFEDITENWKPGFINKTRKATEYLVNNYDFDFMLRTNLSTFWILPRLLERLKTLPTKECFMGDRTILEPYSVVGTGLILSYDVAKDFAQAQSDLDQINTTLPEDKTFTQWLVQFRKLTPQFYSYKNTPRSIIEKKSYIKSEIDGIIKDADILNRDHFRIKAPENRDTVDPLIYQHLLKHYYNIDFTV